MEGRRPLSSISRPARTCGHIWSFSHRFCRQVRTWPEQVDHLLKCRPAGPQPKGHPILRLRKCGAPGCMAPHLGHQAHLVHGNDAAASAYVQLGQDGQAQQRAHLHRRDACTCGKVKRCTTSTESMCRTPLLGPASPLVYWYPPRRVSAQWHRTGTASGASSLRRQQRTWHMLLSSLTVPNAQAAQFLRMLADCRTPELHMPCAACSPDMMAHHLLQIESTRALTPSLSTWLQVA